MEEYPRTPAEFDALFGNEEGCRDYLFRLRWPNGFRCPRCQHQRAWPTGTERFQCAACDYQVSVTAGTIFQDTHKPLTLWFRAMWWITSQKTGVSALGLQRVLGLGSYKTAWTWLHKLRRAMVRPGRDRLTGRIEVDDTYVGGPEEGRRGRGTLEKAILVVAAEEDGDGIGRIRMRRVKDCSAESLQAFVQDAVDPGSVVHTDGWQGYAGLKEKGYGHEVTEIVDSGKTGSELLPRVHRVVSLLKRWMMGTPQGAVSHDHLDYYLDEFTFRFNRRKSKHRGKLFYRLVQQAANVAPVPYRLVKHNHSPNHNG